MNRRLGSYWLILAAVTFAAVFTACTQQPAASKAGAAQTQSQEPGPAVVAAAEDRTFRIPPDEMPQPVSTTGEVLLKESTALIQAPEARDTFKVSGAGLSAAILDTGINKDHVDFGKDRIPVQLNYTPDNGGKEDDANDGQGHGTNVAGIVGAREKYPQPMAQGMHTGVAPGANLIPMKILQNNGRGDFAWVERALQWVLDNHARYRIGVANLSLGNATNTASDDDLADNTIRKLVQQLRAQKVAVVVAAGNDYYRYKAQGMAFPAIIRETVSVGAVYDADVGGMAYQSGAVANNTAKDRITPFSQRLHESFAVPTRTDIFAPGAVVTSTGIGGPRTELNQQGTSQAAPMTAGVILLMQEYYFRVKQDMPSIDDVEKWLRQGADMVKDDCNDCDNVPHTKLNFPRVNALNTLTAMKKAIEP